MLKVFHSSGEKKLLILVAGILVLAVAVVLYLRPTPFNAYVPADCIGYLEVPSLEDVVHLIRDPRFLADARNEAQTIAARQWINAFLTRLEISPQRLSRTQIGVILTSASAEAGQTIKVNGVLVVRIRAYGVKNLNLAPRTVAEKLALPDSFISTETLRGQDVVVLSRSQPDQKIYVTVHRDAVLFSNQRDALSGVLATMEGRSPSIVESSSWKMASPSYPDRPVLQGFFIGSSVLNLVRDFLVRNYTPFEDPARTTRFLAALGLDQVQAIHYHAQVRGSEVRDSWHFHWAASTASSPSLLSIFVHQSGTGMESIPLNSMPSNTASARYISVAQSQEMWGLLANAIGIITNQEAPQNRDLIIAMFEGALGFRIQRDLLVNLSGGVALLELERSPQDSDPRSRGAEKESSKGWLLALKTSNPAQLEKALSKIIAEDRSPKTQQVGSTTVFFSDLGSKVPAPLSHVLDGIPAYATQRNVVYFAPNKDDLVSAIQSLQQRSDMLPPDLPPLLDPHAPYLSLALSPAEGGVRGTGPAPPQPPRRRLISASEIKEDQGGFRYLQVSSCGFLCDLLVETTRAVY
jgi:hypothetical protein